jgi:hypothetical protein
VFDCNKNEDYFGPGSKLGKDKYLKTSIFEQDYDLSESLPNVNKY